MKEVFYQREAIHTLAELVERAAKLYKDHNAITFKRGSTVMSKTYQQMKVDIQAVAGGLSDMDLVQKHIAVLGSSSYEWIVTYLAVTNSGGVIVPMDKELDAQDIVQLLSRADIDGLVYDDEYQDIAKIVRQEIPNIQMIQMYDDVKWEHSKSLQTILAESRPHPEVDILPDDPAAILYTSGTTGERKGVILTHQNLTHAALCGCGCINIGSEDSVLSVLPIHHAYEFTCGILCMIYFGTQICINDSLKYISKNLALFQPTTMFVVPLLVETMYQKIWDEAKRSGQERKLRTGIAVSNALLKIGIDIRRTLFRQVLQAFGGKLKLIMCGGAFMRPELIKAFYEFGITLVQGYGITECSPLVAGNTDRYSVDSSVGKIVPYCQVKIVEGEIWVKGSIVTQGYYKDAAATDAAFSDGWFKTGDLGTLDQDGFLTITGRKKNLIILSNGENVCPEELEQKLLKSPLVREVVIYAHQDGKSEQIIAEIFPDLDYAKQHDITDITDQLNVIIKQTNCSLPLSHRIQALKVRDEEFIKTTTKKIQRFKVEENQHV